MFTLSQQAAGVETFRELGTSLSSHVSYGFADAQIKYSYLISTVLSKHPDTTIKLLDLGCGDGHIAQTFANIGYNNVVGVDRARPRLIKNRPGRVRDFYPYLKRTVRNFSLLLLKPRFQFIKADALSFLSSQASESFDVVIDACSMTHFDTKASLNPDLPGVNNGFAIALTEIYRVLKPGGRLISAMDVLVESTNLNSSKLEFFDEEALRKCVLKVFPSTIFDEHKSAWNENSEQFRFVALEGRDRLILGVTGFESKKTLKEDV